MNDSDRITSICGAHLEQAPPRRYSTNKRTEYAFADLRHRLAEDLGGAGIGIAVGGQETNAESPDSGGYAARGVMENRKPQKMIIEISKAGFINKGAELMLLAALQKLRSKYPEAIFTVATSSAAGCMPFRKVVDLGLYPKLSIYRFGVNWSDLAKIAPKKLLEMGGLILDSEIDVVVDAAGFLYSDELGTEGVKRLAISAKRWKKQGTALILMPQAFGPFSSQKSRLWINKAVEHADLLIARDRMSFEHLRAAVGNCDKIKQYPDFTNLIDGFLPTSFDSSANRVCLVPNFRMVEKGIKENRSKYLPFMTRCAKYLVDLGAKPFILVHERVNDLGLANALSVSVGGIPIIYEDNPLAIKGIIGSSHAMIGSRYHGLVSALSQGTPCLGTGWSHKYSELFEDYRYPSGLLPVAINEKALVERMKLVTDWDSNRAISASLLGESLRLKSYSEKMWEEVFGVIEQITRR